MLFINAIIFLFLINYANAEDFLNKKITIPNGIYCLEDLVKNIQKQTNIHFKIQSQSYESVFSLKDVKDKPLDVLLKPISMSAKVELKFDKENPYFLIDVNKKRDEKAELIILELENTNLKDLLAFIAKNEGKELLIKNNEKADEKINVKCKNGISLESLLNSINNFYESKIVVEKEKIILE